MHVFSPPPTLLLSGASRGYSYDCPHYYILLRIHLGTVVQVQVHTRIFEQGSCVFRLPGSPPHTHHNLGP